MMEVEGWRTRRDFVVKKEEEEKKKARLHDILQAPAAPAAPAPAAEAMAMVSLSVEHKLCSPVVDLKEGVGLEVRALRLSLS